MNASGVVERGSAMNETKTFRGRSLEEVLPQIKADLGPDAEIIRQREGLTGGVGGFFQRACIEVEARPGDAVEETPAARFDAYDDDQPAFEPDPLADEATEEGLATPGIQEILRQAVPFADHLEIAASRAQPEPEPEPAFEPAFEPGRFEPKAVAEPAAFDPFKAPVVMPTQPTAGARAKPVA